jgi:hypothetical protein
MPTDEEYIPASQLETPPNIHACSTASNVSDSPQLKGSGPPSMVSDESENNSEMTFEVQISNHKRVRDIVVVPI